MVSHAKKITAVFFRTASGKEPVREWLKSLPMEAKRKIGMDVMKVEYGWPLGMPLSRPMGSGLHEVRSNLANTTARILFCIDREEKMVLLHGFVKKTRTTPDSDLKLALERKKEWETGHEQ